jgi:hypothetical protein
VLKPASKSARSLSIPFERRYLIVAAALAMVKRLLSSSSSSSSSVTNGFLISTRRDFDAMSVSSFRVGSLLLNHRRGWVF